jgi:ATP-binding protein involved in chromosome partitioning
MKKRNLKLVSKIIAVSSCKGGVGKSTTAANIALALKQLGYKVGVMDADIYGPSQALIFGVEDTIRANDRFKLEPAESYGIKIISMGMIARDARAMIWRGPMAAAMLEQLIKETDWGELDYLVIDMPPGTGDINLRITEMLKIHGAIIVTTPQDVALLDVKKGITMFEKTDTKVLGVIENMAMHVCSDCGKVEHIFGSDGGSKISEQFNIPLLGSLPLDIRIRETSDSGKPIMVAEIGSVLSNEYLSIAEKIVKCDV